MWMRTMRVEMKGKVGIFRMEIGGDLQSSEECCLGMGLLVSCTGRVELAMWWGHAWRDGELGCAAVCCRLGRRAWSPSIVQDSAGRGTPAGLGVVVSW